MRLTNQRPEVVFWRTFNRGDTVYAAGRTQGEIPSGGSGVVDHPDLRFKLELKSRSFWGSHIVFPGAVHSQGDQLILTSDGRLVVDTGGGGNGAEVRTRVYANEAEKARFADANDRQLASLVPIRPNDPPIAAYPTFNDTMAPDGEEIHQLVVLRRSMAEISLVPFGNSSNELQAAEIDPLPLIFARAGWLTLNPAGTGSGVAAPQIAPGAVWNDVYGVALPTFLVSTRPGIGRRRQMAIATLRRPMLGDPNPAVRVASVPVTSIPCHPSDVGRAPTLTPGDLAAPESVRIVMRAVQRFATDRGYAAGLPAFATSPSDQMIRIAFITGADVVSVGARSSRRAFWGATTLPTPVMTGTSAPWGIAAVPAAVTGAAVFTSSDVGLAVTVVGSAPTPSTAVIDPSAGRVAPLQRIGFQVSACRVGPTIHLLYSDGRLLHRAVPVASALTSTGAMSVIDGNGTRICGAASAIVHRRVGNDDQLHGFYLETGVSGTTDQATRDNLRHAFFTAAAGWTTQPADGHVGDSEGRVLSAIEPFIAAVVTPDGTVEAYYYDTGDGSLRRCLVRPGEITPSGFAVVDGGAPRVGGVPGTGPTTARVGPFPTAAVFDGEVHLFYSDVTHNNIRWARRPVGDTSLAAWRYGVLDGAGGRPGATRNHVNGPRSCVWNGMLSVAYGDNTSGLIRHATLRQGGSWTYETIDQGFGAPAIAPSESGGLPLVLAYRGADTTTGSVRAALLSPA